MDLCWIILPNKMIVMTKGGEKCQNKKDQTRMH